MVDRFRHSGRPEVLGKALSRLASICSAHERYEEALRFRAAERLVYETRLLALAVAEATASVPEQGGSEEERAEKKLRLSARLGPFFVIERHHGWLLVLPEVLHPCPGLVRAFSCLQR